MRNNQQGVLYFSSPFKPEVLAAQSNASSNDFFVRTFPNLSCDACPVPMADQLSSLKGL